jgi:hypothetical protein
LRYRSLQIKRYLFYAAILGTFIGVTNFALAAEGSPKEESSPDSAERRRDSGTSYKGD